MNGKFELLAKHLNGRQLFINGHFELPFRERQWVDKYSIEVINDSMEVMSDARVTVKTCLLQVEEILFMGTTSKFK